MSIEDLRTELDEEDNINSIEDNQKVESHEDPEETQDESNQSDDETSEDEEFVITVGDEEPEPSDDDFSGKPAPAWVKDLRKQSREDKKRIKELEAQVQQAKPAEKPIEVGPKPKLADFDYDEDQFESAVEQWHERKRQVEQQQAAKQAEEEKAKQAWQAKMQSYEERRQNVASKVADTPKRKNNKQQRQRDIQESVSVRLQ